ncbi:hypothetical protein HanHA300_Chr15g0566801 [Helianthus annuus]|nr:hypothetical protein HanHA300_Chr15g0566801 [Helianthus annuus]KAJ0473246.1 hypothetical protein HanHA89_Chr15g0616141 [Helianthus annuus]KAJ0648837.1 hypothetical protein HanLR1_Chr15g0577341 [Helianthus annuus]
MKGHCLLLLAILVCTRLRQACLHLLLLLEEALPFLNGLCLLQHEERFDLRLLLEKAFMGNAAKQMDVLHNRVKEVA